MPAPKNAKKPTDHRSKVAGRVFTWTTEDGATITIPLRINMAVLKVMPDGEMDAAAMLAVIDEIAPGQEDVIDLTDVNDFIACFTAWQSAYNESTGATLGEAVGSSA